MDINERCRVSEDLAAHQLTIEEDYRDEDTGQPVHSIFACSSVVAEPDFNRQEARRNRIVRQARAIEALNAKNKATVAEREMLRDIEVAKNG